VKAYPTDSIRNVALVSHANAGKTSLVEALLFNAKAVERLGKVDAGTATADFDSQERDRGVSIGASLCAFEHMGVKINALDTPGYADFIAEAISCLRVSDGAVIVVDATAGVEVGTERMWRYCDTYELPRLIVINKLDKESASFADCVSAIRQRLSNRAVPIHVPIGSAASFKGFVDLVEMKAYTAAGDMGPAAAGEIPADMADAIEEARMALVEGVAESDDTLLEKYLDTGELSADEVRNALLDAVRSGGLVPILCTSATRNIGARHVADAVSSLLPAPRRKTLEGKTPDGDGDVTREPSSDGPFCGYVFKTFIDEYVGRISLLRVYDGQARPDSPVTNTVSGQKERLGQILSLRGRNQEVLPHGDLGDIVAVGRLGNTLTNHTLCAPNQPMVLPVTELPEPMFSASLQAKSREDQEKIAQVLARLTEEDVALRFFRDEETEEAIIEGMGQLHLEIAIRRLRERGVEAELGKPKIPYRETVRRKTEHMYRHKKQTGGRGQFAQVSLRIEPTERGDGFQFVNEIKGAVISGGYIPGVEKGVREGMGRGILAGFPVVDVRVAVFDGKEHPVDSSELAFRIAASRCFAEGARQCDPILLEPVVVVDVVTPDDSMGEIISDLNGKRGRILGMDPMGGNQIVHAHVPLAELSSYGAELHSLTGGRAYYSVTPSHYEEVPPHLVDAIVREYGRKVEEEEE